MRRGCSVLLASSYAVALASCDSFGRKTRENMAGTYRYEMSDSNVTMSKTLTLRPDGGATLSLAGDLRGTSVSDTLQGTFVLNRMALTTRFRGLNGGVLRFRITGDTLLGQPTFNEVRPRMAGDKVPDRTDETFVRIH